MIKGITSKGRDWSLRVDSFEDTSWPLISQSIKFRVLKVRVHQ